jgi:probable addiction module antidote protein
MPKRTTDFREDLLADLTDPREAAHYLNAALMDSNEMLLVALRDVAEARQMSAVANEAGVAREALYRMLSRNGNPTYASLLGVLKSLSLGIQIVPAGQSVRPHKEKRRSQAGAQNFADMPRRRAPKPAPGCRTPKKRA